MREVELDFSVSMSSVNEWFSESIFSETDFFRRTAKITTQHVPQNRMCEFKIKTIVRKMETIGTIAFDGAERRLRAHCVVQPPVRKPEMHFSE